MNGTLIATADLTSAMRDAMYALLGRHFQGVCAEQFHRDLAEKNWVVLLHRGGELIGFSTFHYYPATFEGETFHVVFSGDTIVDPTGWNSPALPRTWIESVRSVHANEGSGRLYWLLITSGQRTYRFLPVFWQRFLPRFDHAAPGRDARLLRHLAMRRFGKQFDPATGVVRFDRPQVLSPKLRETPAALQQDPHVAFFHRTNPGWRDGDELVCLNEIDEANLTRAGARMVFGPQGVTL